MTEEQRKHSLRVSQAKYQRKLKSFLLRFRKKEDADVIVRLQSVENITDYIRGLVRTDIKDKK